MWSSSGRTIANIDVAGIGGEPGLGMHRLLFHVRFSVFPHAVQPPQGEQRVVVRDVGGDVKIQGRGGTGRIVGHLEPWDGPVVIQTSTHHQDNVRHTFALDLSRGALSAIEDLRQGGELVFTISLYGVGDLPTGIEVLRDDLTYRVNQGTWVETLGKLGYGKVMLMEIPVPDASNSPELATAVTHLANAQQAMARGHYREAVGSCRDCLESLSVALGDNDSQDTAFQPMFDRVRELDKPGRIRLVRRATKLLTHPARHADADAARIDWDRADAEGVIAVVAALVQLAARRDAGQSLP